jgi:L-glutamine-phosphate cytidylyltransferase
MKVFILAAGVGSRLSCVAEGRPKCMLRVGGKALIEWTLDRLAMYGLTDITLVTGFRADVIHEAIGARVRYRHNPFYRVTNSLASLWFARDLLTDEALVLNGDLFFEPRLLEAVLGESKSPVLFADTSRIVEADYRFALEGDRIVNYGKEIPVADTHAEYVGIARIAASDMAEFRARIESFVETERYSKWWEDALYSLIPEGRPVYSNDVAGTFWAEADFVHDYERILAWVAAHPERA